MKHNFTIRVYGLCINKNNHILLSDERIGDFQFTKFPGGGLEYGEGTLEALCREWKEELNTDIIVLEHFYTTDFFQASAFHHNVQVVSIYYKVKLLNEKQLKTTDKKFNFDFVSQEETKARWFDLNILSTQELTFPIDQHVVTLLRKNMISII